MCTLPLIYIAIGVNENVYNEAEFDRCLLQRNFIDVIVVFSPFPEGFLEYENSAVYLCLYLRVFGACAYVPNQIKEQMKKVEHSSDLN